jgi:hypothetical protein
MGYERRIYALEKHGNERRRALSIWLWRYCKGADIGFGSCKQELVDQPHGELGTCAEKTSRHGRARASAPPAGVRLPPEESASARHWPRGEPVNRLRRKRQLGSGSHECTAAPNRVGWQMLA